MNILEINQFTPTIVDGDGVSNSLFYIQKILKSLGFVSKIYAKDIAPILNNRVLSYKKIDLNSKNQIFFIHYSIYYDFSEWIEDLKSKKIMIYHNVTPYHFFEEGSLLFNECKKGVEYLPKLSNRVDGAVGVSRLNSEELKRYNFKNVATIPLLVDSEKILHAKWDRELYNELVDEFTIIFVGRVAKNKAQHHLIEIANIYAKIYSEFKFYIIGGVTDTDYNHHLVNLISKYSLEDNVILTGKVSNDELYSYYRGADIFLCMSEHEGFGIPLIEAMLFKTPIIAYNSSNIKSTLNGGGILFNQKSFKEIASVIELLRVNRAFRRAVLETQREAIKVYRYREIVNSLVKYLNKIGVDVEVDMSKSRDEKESIEFQFEGPFDSSYSLAILNRYSALTFDKKYPNEVSLYSTEGGGDFKPNSRFLKENPQIDRLYQLSKKDLDLKVLFRNLYPPRVTGMRGDLNLLNSYGWEESGFPIEYVEQFNRHLDGITVMSKYVEKVLISNGVKVPIDVVGVGVDHILGIEPKEFKLNTEKSFKFLHISSAFPRKGVDTLLKAYTESFTGEDDVTLIIKTFPNPHNNIADEVKRIKKISNSPEIILINRDLPDENIVWLYKNCNALVAPSRGEGFGLPMAEAMLFKLPVITTNFGGQKDFCDNENSWLIEFSVEKAKTHFNLFNSYWVEPSLEDLKRILREMVTLSESEIRKKVESAYNLISKNFRWENYRDRTEKFISKVKNEKVFQPKQRLAWVSSYNSRCGIASYSHHLLEELKYKYKIKIYADSNSSPIDREIEDGVVRCWGNRNDKSNKKLIESIKSYNPDHLVINFNFGFFSLKNLASIIEKFSDISIAIIFHSTADVTIGDVLVSLKEITSHLNRVKVIVHNIEDINHLRSVGVDIENIYLFPHGVKRYRESFVMREKIFTLSSYGFFLPHKGLLELIEAFAILQKEFNYLKLSLVNAIYPIKDSKEYFNICKKRVKELNLSDSVEFHTDFLRDEDSFKLLDETDLIILPYHSTQESSSASVRFALSTLKPVVCTPQSIFNDVEDIVHFSTGYSPKELAESIKRLILNKKLLYSKIERQQSWLREHNWEVVSRRLETILNSSI